MQTLSEALKYHIDCGLDLSTTVFRIGSDEYNSLHAEVRQVVEQIERNEFNGGIILEKEDKKYYNPEHSILSGISAWKAKHLNVGEVGYYQGKKVTLDTPKRGGKKKFYVYTATGKTDKEGNRKAKKIEWGSTEHTIKNDDPGAAASFWARHNCESKEKMNPLKTGFWACWAPTLFGKALGLKSTKPW